MIDSPLQTAIANITVPGLAWGLVKIGTNGALFEEEERAIVKAIPARRAEFLAGRLAARQAIANLGLLPGCIAMGPDRAPIWPTGVVGSISHTAGFAIAAVGMVEQFLGLGVDIELDTPLAQDLIAEVADIAELSENPNAPLLARRIFSAKEAVFKAQYPITKVMFGYSSVQIDLRKQTARFVDHPDLIHLPIEWRQRLMPVLQQISDGYVLSLSAFSRG